MKNLLIHSKNNKRRKTTEWTTNGGNFYTNFELPLSFSFPEFAPSKNVEWIVQLDENTNTHNYDMIIGRDLQAELKMDILWSKQCIRWDDITIPLRKNLNNDILRAWKIKNCQWIHDTLRQQEEGEVVMAAVERTAKILDAKYEKADVSTYVDEQQHLNNSEKTKLKKLLLDFESLFDGTLGVFNTNPVSLKLKDDAKPRHASTYTVPHVLENTFKKELERLEDLGVLRKNNDSPWAAGCFLQPKKNGTVRFLTDFRYLNSQLERKPYPIPHIQDTLRQITGVHSGIRPGFKYGLLHYPFGPRCTKTVYNNYPVGQI